MLPVPPLNGRPRAFLTCSTRARAVLDPILDAAERLLLDLGWRTRLPRRAPHGTTDLQERRRLRAESYTEVENSDVVLHLPAPAPLAGARMHRELNHAVRQQRPILVFVASELRQAHGIEAPAANRLAELEQITGASLVETLVDLEAQLRRWPTDPLPD